MRRKRSEEQLDKELRFHLEQHTADLIAQGLDPAEARRQARLALGGPEQVKEECRDVRPARWLEDLGKDAAYALRAMRQKPGFAAVALATLAMGIGATTVMFTVVEGVLLKPLPYPQPERLLAVYGRSAAWNTAVYGEQNLAHDDFLDLQRETGAADLAGWLYDSGTMTQPGEPEHVLLYETSSNFFSVLGVPLFRGRPFTGAEDAPGGAPVAILGYSLWQRRFAGDPAVLGRSIVLNEKRYTVVGIAAQGFRMDGEEADVYTPMGQNTLGFMTNRYAHPVGTIARLRPGATLAKAQAQMAGVGRRLALQYPDTNKSRSFVAEPLRPDVGDVRSTLWLLLGAVGLALAIACANVASLLVARAVSRERELAMRMALGAGRGRLVRQCLTESAVLALVGGALGVVLAALGLRPFVAFWPGSLPRAEEVTLDWQVLLFALAVSLATGLFFGLAPALRVPVTNLEMRLRAGGRTLAAGSRRLHGGFVVSEIALAVVLLVAAGMLGRTLLRLSALDPGVDTHNVLITRVGLATATLADPSRTRAAWDDILERARHVPGVLSVAAVDTVPMRQGNNQVGYWTNKSLPPENQRPLALATSVTPDYFQVMGIRLLEGRLFDDRDRKGSEPVVVIDDVMAREAFGGQDALGKHLWINLGDDLARVIGVVGHVRHWGLAGDDRARVRAEFYYPFAQVPDPLVRRWSELMSIAVKTGVPPLSVVQPLRRAVRGAAGDQVLYEVRTLDQLARSTLDRQRFLLLLFGIFGGLSLLLACIGIYGVLAYLTGLRVPEFGVRVALGATARDVTRLVLRQSLGMILLGVAAGALAAIVAARVLQRLVDGMRPAEPLTFAGMISALVMAALLASFVPARRAGRVDPMRALREE